MGVGLQPLEFTECLADSPHFRDNLQRHEKELERTSQQIKRLIKEVKDVVQAAKRLGAAQLALAGSMEQFEFACIGASMTEDERVISRSLHHFAHLIRTIEDERDRMLGRAHEQIIQPLERFRKEHIGAVKEGKKKFDKKTAKFCQTQERTLALSTKKPDAVFQEADAAMEMAERDFCQASLEYVFQLQAVQERKKFELVETLLGFVFGWWTFYHTAHDVHADAEPRVRDLQLRIQRTRSNFEETSKQTESLMKKIMEVRHMSKEEDVGGEEGAGVGAGAGGGALAGYLFLMEKKAFGTTTWSKQYCTYEKGPRVLTLTPYNQINVKASAGTESVCVCGARAASEPVERRFCWEAVPEERERPPLTLQALSEGSRAAWLRALHAAPRAPAAHPAPHAPQTERGEGSCALDEAGFSFVRALIATIEARGLDEQGLYRVAGVASKVSGLVALGAGGRLAAGALADPLLWETRTLASALKAFLRALPEPLLTRRLHDRFIAAAKCERSSERLRGITGLVRALPPAHRDMLRLVLRHLRNVSRCSGANLMSCGNLAVCFGPTLLRAARETVASILDLKFYNVVAETLIAHCDHVFPPEEDAPPAAPPPPPPAAPPAPHNGLQGASPTPPLAAAAARNDMGVMERVSVSASGAGCARYSPHHHQLLTHFAHPPPPPAQHPHPHPLAAHTVRPRRASSSSPESAASSRSASPPPPHTALPPRTAHLAPHPALLDARGALTCRRVRTLYACLGESEGELSFEPNQIITNVAPSGEPGWLRGSLDGRHGLVPENYVEPLP